MSIESLVLFLVTLSSGPAPIGRPAEGRGFPIACPRFVIPEGARVPMPDLPEFVPPEIEEPEVTAPDDPLAEVSRDSTSLGMANDGSLRRGVELRSGPGIRLAPRKVHHGTVELVGLVTRAAREVASAYPGSLLTVGNMSKPRGGRIGVSVSHQSGRDVDLYFYALDARSGERVPGPRHMVKYGPDGLSKDRRLRFDVARNWALVEALLEDPVPVQWIFVEAHLKKLLLQEGLRRGASPEVLDKAAKAMAQPSDSAPHADHFHVRIFCPPDDLMDGCVDYGPERWWARYPRRAMDERVHALEALATDRAAPVERRVRALELLSRLRARGAWQTLVGLVHDPEVGEAASRALLAVHPREAATSLAQALGRLGAGRVGLVALDALERMEEPSVWPWLLDLATRSTPDVAARALDVIRTLGPRDALPAVIDAWPALPRRATRRLLAGLAGTDAPKTRRAWARWWAQHRREPAVEWLVSGMRAAGYPVLDPVCSVANVELLIPALRDSREHVRDMARDWIRAIVNMRPWHPGLKRLGPRFWRRWWRRMGRLALEEERSRHTPQRKKGKSTAP